MKQLLTNKWKTHLIWLIILLIFCGILYGKQQSINSFKHQMQKFQLDNLAFEEEINEKGQRIVSQEQIILSQEDAIEQGLLELDRLKKVQSQVNVVTETIIDTFIVSHTDTIVQYIEGDAFLKLPHTYNYYTEHLNFGAEVSSQGLKVNNISILNTSSITIGYKNNGLFMVSYDYRDEVKELYKDYNVKTITMKYAGATDESRAKERKEYVITNYEPEVQVEMF